MPTSRIRKMSWEDSRANCLKHGADLVSILNSAEVDFINKQTKAIGRYYKFWIGLFRNKTTSDPKKKGWTWSDGNTFTNPQQWRSDQPDNYQNNEKCAEVKDQWNDNNCANLYSSICKRKKVLYFIYLLIIYNISIKNILAIQLSSFRTLFCTYRF